MKATTYAFATFTSLRRFSHSSFPIKGSELGGYAKRTHITDDHGAKKEREPTIEGQKHEFHSEYMQPCLFRAGAIQPMVLSY